MKLLIDTNIILDVLLKREPFCRDAAEVLNMVKKSDVQEYVSASAVTDIYYIAYRQLKDKAVVRKLLKELFVVVGVASVAEREICNALKLEWKDFEDSVQYSVALMQDMDAIITRNAKDYENNDIRIWTPAEALEIIG